MASAIQIDCYGDETLEHCLLGIGIYRRRSFGWRMTVITDDFGTLVEYVMDYRLVLFLEC